jgi:hypothetical protein
MTKKLMVAFLFIAASARADFNSLVHIVASTHGMHRVWTPGISLVRLGVRIIHPEGVHDLQLAIFEGNGDIDVDRIVRTNSATPVVRVHERRSGETTVIWARPVSGDLMEMLLVAHEPNDSTVVLRAVVDGETLARELADPRHAADIAKR